MAKTHATWQRHLAEFKSVLEGQGKDCPELFCQAVVLTADVLTADQIDASKLEMGGGFRKLLCPPLRLPIDGGGEECYFIFGENKEVWEDFRLCVHGHEKAWSQIPAEIMPRTKKIRGMAGADAAVVRWLRGISYLAAQFPSRLLPYEWKCSTAIGHVALNFQHMHECDLPSDFNLRQFFYEPENIKTDLVNWQEEHPGEDFQLPGAVTAYCDKNLYYISSNATSFVLEQSALVGDLPEPPRRGRRATKRKEIEREKLISALYTHHVEKGSYEILQRNEIAMKEPALFTVMDPETGERRPREATMSRLLNELFSGDAVRVTGKTGMEAYKRLCRSRRIRAFLERRVDGEPSRFYQSGNIDQYSE